MANTQAVSNQAVSNQAGAQASGGQVSASPSALSENQYIFIVKEKLYSDEPLAFQAMYPASQRAEAEEKLATKCNTAKATAETYPNRKELHWTSRFYVANVDSAAEQRLCQAAANGESGNASALQAGTFNPKNAHYIFIVEDKPGKSGAPYVYAMFPVDKQAEAERYFIAKCNIARNTANGTWKPRFLTGSIDAKAEQQYCGK